MSKFSVNLTLHKLVEAIDSGPLRTSSLRISGSRPCRFHGEHIYKPLYLPISITTCTRSRSDYKAVRRGVINSKGIKVTQGPDRAFTISNRVLYKEPKEGTYKIVDVNMMLLA